MTALKHPQNKKKGSGTFSIINTRQSLQWLTAVVPRVTQMIIHPHPAPETTTGHLSGSAGCPRAWLFCLHSPRHPSRGPRRKTVAKNSLEFVTGTPKAKSDTSARRDQLNIPTDGLTDNRTVRPTCRQADGQTDRPTDRETHGSY